MCDPKDGTYLRERLVDCITHQRKAVDIFEGILPMRRAIATTFQNPAGSDRTHVTLSMSALMKPQFRKLILSLLDSNAVHVEGVAA